ncbi:MAG: acetylxylan esterase [Planctomycetaceae bacterium]|nr:acetylxylan esterase [Planctomycetaceae bacterium]
MLRCLLVGSLLVSMASGADRSLDENPQLAEYFESVVSSIEKKSDLKRFKSLQHWEKERGHLRGQLFEMLGLDPLPEKTELRPVITGEIEEADFRVQKLHFQSLPGLYVTGNMYLPKEVKEPLPTILYVCGHARMKDGDISLGNKTGYQHHGAWFARNGYACLTIDTLQLGEIEGVHHGTYSHGRWWWNNRGYTPAGVEAWNCIRALDYLETRPEVDKTRFGVTGRSGGGAYSWWIAALDDRIQCAVPVAGITSLRNHVVDGCVEGHCDCMYMVNTYRWDYATVAALIAPRPLLISNTDKDGIFPLEGVVDVHRQVRHIYQLYGKPDHLGLQITEGPHKDTQELRVHAFRWMNRWLRKTDDLVELTATKFFEPTQLRVFETLPADERNTTIDEVFVAEPQRTPAETLQQSSPSELRELLKNKCFAAWPKEQGGSVAPKIVRVEVLAAGEKVADAKPRLNVVRMFFDSEPHVELFADVLIPTGLEFDRDSNDLKVLQQAAGAKLVIVDDAGWKQWAADLQACAEKSDAAEIAQQLSAIASDWDASGTLPAVVFCPRGMGPDEWKGDEKKQTQIRRRFQLTGATADGMRVWDCCQTARLLQRTLQSNATLELQGRGRTGWLAIATAVFVPEVQRVRAAELSTDSDQVPELLNYQRYFHWSDLLVLALEERDVLLTNCAAEVVAAAKAAVQGRQPFEGHLRIQ